MSNEIATMIGNHYIKWNELQHEIFADTTQQIIDTLPLQCGDTHRRQLRVWAAQF